MEVNLAYYRKRLGEIPKVNRRPGKHARNMERVA